ncbi:FCD domain-containing protein [Jiella sp. MQZ9-1]|uniref:FCD domain-containing protein n=1 Tax=Jiella flava TaxID=2816857 RepID=A0A939FY16_9HYPH|nr:FCD domain-containing protein [Jiella flava]MBO0662275.1 FCD domain-containing protein [Jiella flava]MCD2470894.1 FCD domain-containing protein [Jiella flava]
MSRLAERIETLIAARRLAPGDRLPAERQLAAELGASRSTVREAIKQLTSRGLLVSQRGGGTYLTTPEAGEPVRAALLSIAPLAESEAGYWRDVLEIRTSLEGDIAALAAERADPADRARIVLAYDALAEALLAAPPARRTDGVPLELAKRDAAFHMAITRAAHNAVLTQVMTGLEGLLETSISGILARLYRLPDVLAALDDQHRRILDAIAACRPQAARAAATDHLCFVAARLDQIEQDAARHQRAVNAHRHIEAEKDTRS